MEGRPGCTISWGKIRLPQFAPGSGNRIEEAAEREISAQFNEELPVKRHSGVWFRIWPWSQTSGLQTQASPTI